MEHRATDRLPEFADETLPTDDQACKDGVQADSNLRPACQPSILLLDDDLLILGIHLRMLQSIGYSQITTASVAKEALLQLEHDPNSADVIVCDLSMPDMDGIEFLQTLNASPFHGSVILLSGSGVRVMHSVQKLIGDSQLTILGALSKPVARNSLRALLDCWKPATKPEARAPALSFTADHLRDANRHPQWILHYQPQVNLTTEALVGMEALVRWNHPTYGLVYPNQFIAAAEDCGVIDDLTDWVVQEALKQLASWRAQGLKIQMAVNVSMDSCRARDFFRRFTALVNQAGAAPQDLTLEITESRIMSSSPVSLENLVRLRMEGFTLSIDDFGTGHSSLAQLRDIPFTELKIDRGFVHGASNNQIIRPILEGSLGIAKRMGMRSVAEGVESEADWHLLRQLDCDLAQGYFIGRPMSAERVWEWVNMWRSRHRSPVVT